MLELEGSNRNMTSSYWGGVDFIYKKNKTERNEWFSVNILDIDKY